MSKLRAAFLKAVGEYMLVETPLARADICLLFGNKYHSDHLAEHAAALYHQGYYGRIVASGGTVTEDGRREAHRMRDVLVSKGVPEEIILIEDRATNTGENVAYTRALLAEKGLLDGIKSVLAIGHIHASRRFMMTLEKQWPDSTKLFTTDNCYAAPRDAWHADRAFRQSVMMEYKKIPQYVENGFITEIDLQKMSKAIASLPPPVPPVS